jgi:hypothetical protein
MEGSVEEQFERHDERGGDGLYLWDYVRRPVPAPGSCISDNRPQLEGRSSPEILPHLSRCGSGSNGPAGTLNSACHSPSTLTGPITLLRCRVAWTPSRGQAVLLLGSNRHVSCVCCLDSDSRSGGFIRCFKCCSPLPAVEHQTPSQPRKCEASFQTYPGALSLLTEMVGRNPRGRLRPCPRSPPSCPVEPRSGCRQATPRENFMAGASI